MNDEPSPLFLSLILRVIACLAGVAAVILFGAAVVGDRPTAPPISSVFTCLGSGIGFLWMAQVLDFLQRIAEARPAPTHEAKQPAVATATTAKKQSAPAATTYKLD